jgi:hypothetical protein
VSISENISLITTSIEPALIIGREEPAFRTIVTLGVGDRVKVSGHFVFLQEWKGQYCFTEGSISYNGGVTKPEWLFRFTEVESISR